MANARLPKPNESCWCLSGKKYKHCHKDVKDWLTPRPISPHLEVPSDIQRPDYAESGRPAHRSVDVIRTPEVIERIRAASKIAAEVLQIAGAACKPGVTTDEIDKIAHAACIERGAYPSTLNYNGYPKSICTSVNEVICHGIPDDRPLVDGDIINLDFTAFFNSVHGDTNAMFLVGDVDAGSRKLIDVTRECLDLAIAQVKPGTPIYELGRAIEDHATAHGYGVVTHFVGHGVAEQFHCEPTIPHYFDRRNSREIEAGMTFTIEPMITIGDIRPEIWDDDWTATTRDKSRTAQFEHTMVVTEEGVDVLTVVDSYTPSI